MSEHTPSKNVGEWLEQLPLRRLFCFRTAMMPGKLALALIGLIAIILVGFTMDLMTPVKHKVVVGGSLAGQKSELDVYISGSYREADNFRTHRQELTRDNDRQLKQLLTVAPMSLSDKDAEDQVGSGGGVGMIRQKYQNNLMKGLDVLASRYEIRRQMILSENEGAQDQRDLQSDQNRRLKNLDYAYQNALEAMVSGKKTDMYPADAINQVVEADTRLKGEAFQKEMDGIPSIRGQLRETVDLAKAYQAASAMQRRGIFATLFDFSMNRFHAAVSELVWNQSPGGVKNAVRDVLKADCWLMRFHPIYGVVFAMIKLAVISVIGGAICRIAALQYTRDERIGPVQAVRFSVSRFGSFFTAPLIPMILIAVICGLILAISLVSAIPAIGEIVSGALTVLGLIGGFVAALVAIGLIGGFNLMYPTIAVEGSDNFDAISRSFSYVLSRPWRMGFYTAVSAAYGAICYLFVRFFAFLMLAVLHASVFKSVRVGSLHIGASSMIPTRAKLDAMWPGADVGDLFPSVNWMTLNWSESIGSVLVLLWVGLVAGLVLSFVVSFYFSANTGIYLLLRHRVDATDFEDVYLEEDVNELLAEESGEVSAAAPAVVAPPADTPEPPKA